MNFKTFARLETKNFFAGRAVILAFTCIFLAGAYAVYHGGKIISEQRRVISESPTLEAEHTAKLAGYKKDAELADLLYYLTFHTTDAPSDWAALAVGQRDVNSYNVKVGMLALEGQINNSELNNPTNLLFGNFDLSFVIIFLFPLVIIAFTHHLISAEQETGTWNLLRSQPVSLVLITAWRMILRFTAIAAAGMLLLTLGCVSLGAKFDGRFVAATLLMLAYFAFWFGAAWLVISFGRGSNFNALALVGIWIVLTLLAPALLASIVSTNYPVSETMQTAIAQREGYHEKWDKPKTETMRRFYEKYPEFAAFSMPEDKFSWGWYYAMQQMGDEDSAEASRRLREKLETRRRVTDTAAYFLPTVAAQNGFNAIAQTDLENHLRYLDSVRNYHETIRRFFYPYIFSDAKVADFNLENVPRHRFNDSVSESVVSHRLIGLIIAAIVFVVAGFLNLRRRIDVG